MALHAKKLILFLVTAWYLAVIGFAEGNHQFHHQHSSFRQLLTLASIVNVGELANVKSYGDIVNFAAGKN